MSLTRSRDILNATVSVLLVMVRAILSQIAQLVDHVTKDSECPGYNPGILIIISRISLHVVPLTAPGTNMLTPASGKSLV